MIRLRQVAMIADDIDPVVEQLSSSFGIEVCFHDPGVAEFGLRNALLLVGDQFLEVLSPVEDGTTAGRLLDRRGGPGGYMAIYEVDDLDVRVERLHALGVRIVWQGDFPGIRGRHLHPRDVGGAIVSIDEPQPAGSWRWGGPQWPTMETPDAAVDGITGVVVAATDPERVAARWSELEVDEAVRFVEGDGARNDGIVGVELRAVDRGAVGEYHDIGGVRFTLV
ncbi:MAG: VOC family protein [Actinomycetota bacterium]